MPFANVGFALGMILGALVYLMERTTGHIDWLLVLSFPICFTIAGYLFWRWDIGGYHSEHNKRAVMKIVREAEKDLYRRKP